MRYIGRFNDEKCRILSNANQMDSFFISDMEKVAATNNVLYSQIILTNIKNQESLDITSATPNHSHGLST